METGSSDALAEHQPPISRARFVHSLASKYRHRAGTAIVCTQNGAAEAGEARARPARTSDAEDRESQARDLINAGP